MNQTKEEIIDRVILVGLNANSMDKGDVSTEKTMDELCELVNTAGGEYVGRVLQKKLTPEARTFIGEGKTLEVKMAAEALGANLIVFDNELSPSQIKELESILEIRVIDRSALILDIFAQRANTHEGRLQVELAQYRYLLPRLSGMGLSLSRLGGGVGTRGPGETKLETDRRHIRERISKLESELREVRKVRAVQRDRRIKNEMAVVALVGYTNAGKSTLFNKLTDSDIPANDRLFDTLDPTTRKLRVNDTMEVLISDTVGFIRKLPHHLINAFKATLEELLYADLILHVIDASNPDWREQAAVVSGLIDELGAGATPVIEVFNKMDVCEGDIMPSGEKMISVSALMGRGLDTLKEMIFRTLDTGRRQIRLILPFDRIGVLDMLYKDAKVMRVEYLEDGVLTEVICDAKVYGRVKDYVKKE